MDQLSQTSQLHTPAGAGTLWFGPGDLYRVLATGAESNGSCLVMEATVPPGAGPPPHVHDREDETIYVLEGECTVQLDDTTIVAGPGDFVSMPRGGLHRFSNDTDEPLRLILTFMPADIEGFFEEVFEPGSVNREPPSPSPELVGRLLEAAPRYGLHFVLPEGPAD